MNENAQVIAAALQRIQEEGKQSNFVVFRGDVNRNYYIQFSAEPGASVLHAEAVSNRFLDAKDALSPDQQAQLRALGWTPPQSSGNQGPNFYHRWTCTTDDERLEVAQVIIQTFAEVYGLPTDKPLIVNLVLS